MSIQNYYTIIQHIMFIDIKQVMVQKKIYQNIYIYIYIYDDKGRIKEQKYYDPSHLYDFTPYNVVKEEDLYYTITYDYNEKSQVIKQKISSGTKEMGDYYKEIYVLFSHIIIPENNGSKLEVHYQYDKQDRITQISLYDFNEEEPLIAHSDYTYHPTKDFVEKSKNYFEYNIGAAAWAYPTKRWVSHFNEQGDIIKREFTKDYPEQSTSDTTTRFYEYEYDQYNNWIKCYLYLEGQKVKGDPTLIAERKIEYYK